MKEDKKNNSEKTEKEEMGFFSHLEELRKRVFYASIGIIIACVFTGYFIEPLMNIILLAPAKSVNLSLQNLKPFGIPFLYIKVALISGVILAFPIILFQIWKFIEPGLYEHEKKWARGITFFTSLCFFTGVTFAYYVMIPSMLGFSASFGSADIKNDIDVNEYFGFITMMMLGAGLIFEMPMISFILARFNIITAKMLRKYWRHSVVGILIIAAVLTPSPDPINQMIFATPLFILYELSIWVAKFAERKRIDKTDSE